MNLPLQLRKYLRSYPEWRLAPPRVQLRRALQKVGSEYGGYFFDPAGIGPDAVVYSLGIGEDISFDLSLIHQYGVTVHAFDPTPRVKKWLASQKLPDEFRFHDTGIPPRPDHISHSVVPARQFSQESIPVPMMRLGTAMERLGHSQIGLMKMDIEGAEYGVLEDLVRERILVEQILVEFHHRFSSIGTAKTRRMLSMLEDYGMRICYVCPRIEVFTLVRSAQSAEWAAAAD